ncbi:hypothetical protein IWZ03DRAFT_438968 [Phyllosticta citriasiana]|uniref:Tetraspanin Tsp3 n=1 Tax=Phyllosticta citriasiana TaxID=595635 RepID=A0ABR1KPB8_9PEZI
MAYSKRQIITALSVVYLIVLTALACYAHTCVQRYSLPLPSSISGLLIITPVLTGVLVDRLTRIRPTSRSTALTISPSASYGTFPGAGNGRGGGGGTIPRAVLQLLPRHYLRTQLSALGLTVFLTALASLASPYLTQNRGLTCALDNAWKDLYRAGRGGEIQLIQDAWECCGLHSVYDMAWPFARHSGGVTERSRCRQMYGRETSCYGVWEEEERRTAGIVIGVTAGVWLWKMLVLFTPRHRPSWLSTHGTPSPAPPPRATQQQTPFIPRALTTAPHTSPPPPTPETSSGAFNSSTTRNITKTNKPLVNEVADNSSVTPTNRNFLAKSPSRNIPKRERNRPSALNIPYHAATPDAGYANSPGPEVGDLETSSLYRDTSSDSEGGDSQHHARYDEQFSDDEHELFVNGVPSPALAPSHPNVTGGGVEDATPRGDEPALAQYHLRLANAAANNNNKNNNGISNSSSDSRPSASSQFGVQHYRRSPTAFKFPMSPLSTRSEDTSPSNPTTSSNTPSAQNSRPQSRGDGQAQSDREGGGGGGGGLSNGGFGGGSDVPTTDAASSSSGDDSVQTAVAIDNGTPVLKPSPRRGVPHALVGGRNLSPRPRSRHAVLNGSTGIPTLGKGVAAGHRKSSSSGGIDGGGGGGGGVEKTHTVVPAVLITEVGDDDDEGDGGGGGGEANGERPASRERVLVRAGGDVDDD